jgi:hypothetical protein
MLTNCCHYEKETLMKRSVPFLITLFFITCFAVKADVSVFANSPSGDGGAKSLISRERAGL